MASADSTAPKTVNYYESLSLDREQTTEQVQEQLQRLKDGWSGKAARAGSLGDQARAFLAIIADADLAFADDDAREEYDLRIRRQPPAGSATEVVDWVARAWNYFYLRDEGAATVAAKKAREQDAKDVNAWVVSAWVALLNGKDGFRQAKDFSDEAFVLDELGTDTADVHHVRGVVFASAGEFDKAIKAYDRALSSAHVGERSDILLHKAQALERKWEYDDSFPVALAGLVDDEAGGGTAARSALIASLKLDFVSVTSQSSNEAKLGDHDGKRHLVKSSPMNVEAKSDFLAWADELRNQIQQADIYNQEIVTLDEKIAVLERERNGAAHPAPAGSKPGFPGFQLGFALWSTLWTIIWFTGSGSSSLFAGFGVVSLLIALVAFIVFGVAQSKNSAWEEEMEKSRRATQEIGFLTGQLESRRSEHNAVLVRRETLRRSLPPAAHEWKLDH